VIKVFCDACGTEIKNELEAQEITINVAGEAYFWGNLCREHWTETLEKIAKFGLNSRAGETEQ